MLIKIPKIVIYLPLFFFFFFGYAQGYKFFSGQKMQIYKISKLEEHNLSALEE